VARAGNQGALDGDIEHRQLFAANSNLSAQSLKSGFRFLATGACTINENEIHKYGATLAASSSIMAVR